MPAIFAQQKIVLGLLGWFARNARDLPWRRTRDPYPIWVSEIMLQQTQVKTVLPYWERWMRELPDLPSLAAVSPEKLHKLWEGLGYYTRVRNLQKAAQLVMDRHGGRFPDDYNQVLELPGIGRYTAGAICSIAFNQPKPVLDGNVVRVLSRVFGVTGNARESSTRAQLWRTAEELVVLAAKQWPLRRRPAGAFNQALMELGAVICTPRRAQCGVCPVGKHCVAYREARVQDLPNLGARAPATPRRFVAFVAQRGSRFLVRQRPAGVVNAHLWEFPNVELRMGHFSNSNAARPVRSPRFSVSAATHSLKAELQAEPLDPAVKHAARTVLGRSPKALQSLCTIKHTITRYRITMEVFRVIGQVAAPSPSAHGKWLPPKQLRHLSFSSAHRRILQQLAMGHAAV